MEGPKDVLGRLIQVGDWVAYPSRQGSAMGVQILQVDHIDTLAPDPYFPRRDEKEGRYKLVDSKGKFTTILNRVVLLERPEDVPPDTQAVESQAVDGDGTHSHQWCGSGI